MDTEVDQNELDQAPSAPPTRAFEPTDPGMTGMSLEGSAHWVLNQVCGCLTSDLDRALEAEGVLALLQELEPGTPLEGLLVAQMIPTHIQVMEHMKKARACKCQDDAAHHLAQAYKFERLFLSQLDRLERMRHRKGRPDRAGEQAAARGLQAGPFAEPGPFGKNRP